MLNSKIRVLNLDFDKIIRNSNNNKKIIVIGVENYFYNNLDLNSCIVKIKEIFL